jgi:hypothetical protein
MTDEKKRVTAKDMRRLRKRQDADRIFERIPDWVTLTLLLGVLFVVLPLFLAIVVFGQSFGFP